MPTYYNPYAQNAQLYGQNYPAYSTTSYQAPVQNVQQMPMLRNMEWVEGEIGARAFQIPAGWPANVPIALWDNTDKVVYFKSINPLGAPNPLQKARYTFEEPSGGYLPQDMSGAQAPNMDMSQFVTKQDLDQLRQDIQKLANQNGNNNRNNQTRDNRGENR